MPAKTVIVGSAIGLHARPAAIIAEAVVNAGVPVTLVNSRGKSADLGRSGQAGLFPPVNENGHWSAVDLTPDRAVVVDLHPGHVEGSQQSTNGRLKAFEPELGGVAAPLFLGNRHGQTV